MKKSIKYLVTFRFSVMLKVFLICLISLLSQDCIMAQSNSENKDEVLVYLKNGGVARGELVDSNAKEISIKKQDGSIWIIPQASVSEIITITKAPEEAERVDADDFFFKRKTNGRPSIPMQTKYAIAPTARNLERGQGYYQTYWGLLHRIQFGVTDNFSMGIGTNITGSGILITPKLSIQLAPKSYISVNAMAAYNHHRAVLGLIRSYGALATYTQGSPKNNFSVGAGYFSLERSGFELSGVALTAGGQVSFNKKVSLVFEYLALPEQEYYFGGPSVRLKEKSRFIDFGVWSLSVPEREFESNSLIPVPYVSAHFGF